MNFKIKSVALIMFFSACSGQGTKTNPVCLDEFSSVKYGKICIQQSAVSESETEEVFILNFCAHNNKNIFFRLNSTAILSPDKKSYFLCPIDNGIETSHSFGLLNKEDFNFYEYKIEIEKDSISCLFSRDSKSVLIERINFEEVVVDAYHIDLSTKKITPYVRNGIFSIDNYTTKRQDFETNDKHIGGVSAMSRTAYIKSVLENNCR
ncbi:MAG: hypothetical protein HQK52_18625 [Oligoflexia bacterium]|nr:hypothetical protein [Oligoflexia bacterium]